MKIWIIRLVGVMNVFFGLMGAYYFAFMVKLHWHKWPGSPSTSQWAIFLALTSVSAYMLVYVGYLGVRLIKNDVAALRPLRKLFVLELAYYVIGVFVFWIIMPVSIATIAVSFWSIAQDPLVPQILTGYPLIGIVATSLLLRTRLTSAACGTI